MMGLTPRECLFARFIHAGIQTDRHACAFGKKGKEPLATVHSIATEVYVSVYHTVEVCLYMPHVNQA